MTPFARENTGFDGLDETRTTLIAHVLPHVPFDGWSAESLSAAASEAGIDLTEARLAFRQAGPDMAAFFHRMKDRALADDLAATDLAAMRIRERITHAVRRRIEMIAGDREAVRRAMTLFALPLNTATGARLIWETADTIWCACGDTAEDYNWYTKRMILSGVYSSTVLYWLGDQDPRLAPTWEFLDRRIADVMRFESTKAKVQANPLARAAFALPLGLLGTIRAPRNRTQAQRDGTTPVAEPS